MGSFPRDRRDMLIFHHIPKTAGSTFNHAVVDANQGVCRMFGAGGLSSAPNVDLTSVRFLCGHVTFDEAATRGLDRDNVHVSILRDPLKRIVSHFEMAFRDDAVFREEICSIDKWKFGFRVFYERFIVFNNLTNIQCKYFSKRGKFYDAVVTIAEQFHLVGSAERFDDFLDKALEYFEIQHLKRPAAFPIKNQSSLGEDYRQLIDDDLLCKIEADNAEDFYLWRWLNVRHNGLFSK